MSLRSDELRQKRHELAAQIARQRDELSLAYRHLAKPIQYGEQALKGFGFFRQNPWLFSVVPAAFTIGSAVVGIVRNKPGKETKRSRFPGWGKEEKRAAKVPKSLGGKVLKWGGHGWKLFTLYRKFRRFVS